MDTLTHALSGALLARVLGPARPASTEVSVARRMTIGGLAAAFPDLDFVSAYLSPLGYLHHHRGVTHSLLMLPLWTVLLAWLFALAWRDRAHWRTYAKLSAAGIAIHILGDLITNYGTQLFAPLSDARYAWSTTFIIDLWFSGIILAGLAASGVWRRSRMPAVVALAVLASYVFFQYTQQRRAIAFGVEYAATRGLHAARVTASPRPVSPYNWMVIVEEPQRYHYALVNVARRTMPSPSPTGFIARLDAPYLPLDRAIWVRAERYGSMPGQAALVREAYEQPSFRFFRWFAMYPAVMRIDTGNPATCVWFHDLRFFTPGRASWPFRYGECREDGGAWRPYQLLSDVERVPVY
jgi:inner membrane protein